MAALTRAFAFVAALAAALPLHAQCVITGNGEYANPTAPGCGDVILTYVQHATGDAEDIPLGYPVPVPVDSLTPVDGFRTYASLLAAHQDLATTRIDVAAHKVGATLAGRDIWAYRIGTAGDETVYGQRKSAVLAIGGTHAREWQPPEVIAETIERLVAGAGGGGLEQYLVDNVAVWLVPVLNVDGFLQTQAYPATTTADFRMPRDGRMRRKNLRRPDGGLVDGDLLTVDDNTYGVDLNRNHPEGFRSVAANSSTRSLIHAGATTHSEPEVQALLAAIELGPADRLRLFMDVHSFGQVYFAPQTGGATRDALTAELAARMRAVTSNKYAYSPDPVAARIGTAADHVAATLEIPSWTLEVEPPNGGQDYPGGTGASHSGFITPDAEIARLRRELADTFVLGFYHQAGPPSVAAAEIRDAAGALVWSVDWVAATTGTRTLVERAQTALAPGGDYTLWIAFDKPMRARNAAGTVVQYAGQQARLHPDLALEFDDGSTLDLPAGEWLDAPGPGPDGYLNYRDDAYRVVFTLPGDAPDGAQAVLVVDADSLSGHRLDGDPTTAVDWLDGGWTGYQAQQPDCAYRLWVGAVGTNHDLECKALDDTPTPPPSGGGGGGGGDGGWLLLLLPLALARRAAATCASRSAPTPPAVPAPAASGRSASRPRSRASR